MPLCRLADLPLPSERSSRFIAVLSIQEPSTAERLQYDHDWIGQLQFSTCLHPDARDYFVRLANIFSLGALYYPLYTVASQHSLFALELALRTRFRFETRAFTGLRELLDHATVRKLLLFEQTEVVQSIHRSEEERANYGYPYREPRDVSEIARNRGNLLKDILPDLRNYSAHPRMADLVMPGMAFSAIEHALELANIIYEESEKGLKQFVVDAEIQMDEVRLVDRVISGGEPQKQARLGASGPLLKRDACSAIERAARAFGIHSRASIAFSTLHELGLVSNAAQPVKDLFGRRFDDEDRLSESNANACEALLAGLSEAAQHLARELTMVHDGQQINARLVRSENAFQWILTQDDGERGSSCTLGPGDLSYFHLLRAGLASSLEAATYEIRGLSTILGQRSDAQDWLHLGVAMNHD
jgi:hypothetical protein